MSVRQRVSDKQHRWLSLVETTGIVLSEPVLAETAPAGFRPLDKRKLAEFYKARDIWNLPQGMVEGDPDSRWTDFILEEMLSLKDSAYWQVGAAISPRYVTTLSQQRETLRPTRVLIDGENAALLFLRVPRAQSLDTTWTTNGGWKASATTKLERLLRDTGVEVGLLTNGESWRLVVASPSETASWLTWTAQTWADSPSTLAAFVELLGEARFFAGERSGTILELVRASRHRQADVADQLGFQVREALEFFVREIDRIDAEQQGALLAGYSLDEIFESGVVFIMRLLFLLKAEETGLLPHGSVAYDRAYGVLSLLTRLEETHRLAPEKLERSREAYPQLLATSRVVHEGSPDPDIHVAEYGGALFDPNRFPLLEGRQRDGKWAAPERPEALPIRDSVVRDVLRSLKYARTNAGVHLVSYRTLEVEHIGHMYEGLLDRRLERAPSDEPILLLLASSREAIPEIRASELANLKGDRLVKRLAELTDRTGDRIRALLEPPEEDAWLPDLGTTDPNLVALAEPIRRLVRQRGVVRAGGLYVSSGADRRSQGAHYTPPELTEPVVRNTLEPLVFLGPLDSKPRDQWQLKKSREILALHVCDIAMGSGAFLVQVVRYLGARLVEAWDAESAAQHTGPLTLPFALASVGDSSEALMPEDHDERMDLAQRYVVERCIYGVDKNHLAVEMAKLSLWLATLAKDRPFTFLDHALRCGDTLLGVHDSRQIASFHPNPDRGRRVHETLFDFAASCGPALEMAIKKRHELEDFPVLSVRDARKKAQLLREAEDQLALVSILADALTGTVLANASKGTRVFDAKIVELARHIPATSSGDAKARSASIAILRQSAAEALTISVDGRTHVAKPFNWPLEFPEVFCGDQPGFDAIVGNPPFMGGKMISGALSGAYREHLVSQLASGIKGNADLSAYFFLRAGQLIRPGGLIGLVATNTIAQGDTREVGLDQLLGNGFSCLRAVSSTPWPGEATLEIAEVWLRKGPWHGRFILDGQEVRGIASSLRPPGRVEGRPKRLPENVGLCYQGSVVLGMGFVLTSSEAEDLLASDPKNSAVLFPFLNGEDVNSDPDQKASRWVINFHDWPLDPTSAPAGYSGRTAADFPACLKIVRDRAKPERDRSKRKVYRDRWWQFAERQPALIAALKGRREAIIAPQTSKYLIAAPVPTGQVFSHAVNVFPSESRALFALLQSSIHEAWAREHGSTLETRFKYIPTDCFQTFPFPEDLAYAERIGDRYFAMRKDLTRTRGEGLTRLYNAFHDPAQTITALASFRAIHIELDESIKQAYRWTDLRLEHSFIDTRDGVRFTISDRARREVIDRIAEMNQRAGIEPTSPQQASLPGLTTA